MTEFKFGDVVGDRSGGGVYMVLGEYTGARLANDTKGPAHWTIDIDTEYTEYDGEDIVWWPDKDLEIIERAD